MQLILEENPFQFNAKQFVQTHGIAMGTKMAVVFSVIFMAVLEKQLLTASPLKPFVWKRFIDDIFSLWNVPIEVVSNFCELCYLVPPYNQILPALDIHGFCTSCPKLISASLFANFFPLGPAT